MTKPRLELLEFGVFSGSENMMIDTHFFSICENDPGRCFLRFYGWRNWCISMGRFEPENAIDVAKAKGDGIEIVRRPTGGRAVMHGDDLTYAVVVPIVGRHPNAIYSEISSCLLEGLRALGIDAVFERGHARLVPAVMRPCFASTSRYEITWKGKKLVGSAQRIGRNALLQHGSIAVGRGYLKIIDYMRLDNKERTGISRMMNERTCCLSDIVDLKDVPLKLMADRIVEGFAQFFDMTECNSESLVDLLQRVRQEVGIVNLEADKTT